MIALMIAVLMFLNTCMYTKDATVIAVDRTNEIIAFQDTDGEIWEINQTGDFEAGQKFVLKMYDNCTAEIYDDIILDYWIE